ncbi:putative quinol monooxygenase [Brachybacterium hainanense]|uniref:Quinol monooxygenase n=1 Tax=Brachybacterium hainanense TaxID=1541174 RepID=A0ABV6R7K0_9MICO
MTRVTLTGRLICADAAEAGAVARHLPQHVQLTRAEPGCLSFRVEQTADPLVWQVDELFSDEASFRAHQQRVAASDWGGATAGIVREYRIDPPQD